MSNIIKYMKICLMVAVVLSVVIINMTGTVFSQTKSRNTSITESGLRTQLQFLADDLLEGRETSFRGEKLAAKYIAAEFQKNDLRILNNLNSYFQSFPLVRILISNKSNFSYKDFKNISTNWNNFGKDYFAYGRGFDTTITGKLHFLGYGLSIPKLWNDIDTSISYEGKILIFLSGLPKTFDSSQTKQYSFQGGLNFKRNLARRLKASGIIIISENNKLLQELFPDQYASMLKGIITVPENQSQRDIPLFITNLEIGKQLLGGSKSYDELLKSTLMDKGKSQSLKAEVTLNLVSNITNQTGENVVGVLEGSDPKLKNEYVIITSHYDHVGVNFLNGEIYNGADDDGSGTATVLELAHLFSSMEVKPKRSLIFMTVSGEEKGLLGSKYFVNNSPIPLSSITSNINIDMIGRTDPKHDSLKQDNYIYVIGSDKISLEVDSLLQVANKSHKLIFDYTFNREDDPNRFYYRSDHYNFAVKNIPIIFFFTGTHVDYHQPTDEVDKIRFDLMVNRANLIYSTILQMANFPSQFKKLPSTTEK